MHMNILVNLYMSSCGDSKAQAKKKTVWDLDGLEGRLCLHYISSRSLRLSCS